MATLTPLSNTEIASFCSQMAMVLHSGISAMEGISLMLEETSDEEETNLLKLMDDTLQSTGSFHEALVSTEAFPDYMLHMVQIGEYTGKLDEVMDALTSHYEREASISQSIKNAVTYPLIMVFMMLLVILVLMTKVMPIFNQVFQQLGSEMTGFSKAILDFGITINNYSVILIAVIVLFVILILYFTRTKKGRNSFASFTSRFAWTRSFSEKLAACRFASGMALTLSSGMSPEESLNLVTGLIHNDSFTGKLNSCRESLDKGEDFSRSLLDAGVFSGIYARMTSIGSKTGVLDEVMQEIADKYQEEIDQKFTNMIATLEPTLVIILSLIVGMILLSVMLPLMGIMSSL
ncbi:MAG: type II secretion system F family protein [Dorea sp.]|uniref:type II secretion system F family protein n=1 Tax=Sporofaciens sp. JLR.KK001 TaxID=3112621 RepID=UPI0021714FBC|nr:type II secretion system F family protein [Dorea sp.]